MITINQVVYNKKGQKGAIVRVVTKSTGYVEVAIENGSLLKEMAFNLKDENGISLMKDPKSRYSEPAKIEVLPPLQDAIKKIQWINNTVVGDRHSMSYQVSEEVIAGIDSKAKELGNDFICSVCQSVDRYMRCSDKQAYLLAKFAVENQIKL